MKLSITSGGIGGAVAATTTEVAAGKAIEAAFAEYETMGADTYECPYEAAMRSFAAKTAGAAMVAAIARWSDET